MLTLSIQVPEARDRTALATLIRHNKKIAEGFAAASASPKIAAARGNPECDPLRAWGHPPLGTYRLINHQPSGKDYAGEYGMHLLLFEPLSGPALQAQAAGRGGVFANYRLRVAQVLRDYGLHERDQAPADSRAVHDAAGH